MLTRRSILPNFSIANATSFCGASSSRKSAAKMIASALQHFAASSSRSPDLAARTRRIPSCDNTSAMDRPIPRLAPVTIATLFAKFRFTMVQSDTRAPPNRLPNQVPQWAGCHCPGRRVNRCEPSKRAFLVGGIIHHDRRALRGKPNQKGFEQKESKETRYWGHKYLTFRLSGILLCRCHARATFHFLHFWCRTKKDRGSSESPCCSGQLVL